MILSLSSEAFGRRALFFSALCDWAPIEIVATAKTKRIPKYFFTRVTLTTIHGSVRAHLGSLAMGVEPGFGLLAGGGDLHTGHLGSQPFRARFSILVTLGQPELNPKESFSQILPNSPPP